MSSAMHEAGRIGRRIFRLGYTDPRYARDGAASSGTVRRALEAEAGRLLHPTPQLTSGPARTHWSSPLVAAGAWSSA
jgi:hypothetical protein